MSPRPTARWVTPSLYLGVTLLAFFPAWLEPRRNIVGDWRHPDCLSNHWLYRWVADRLAAGEGLTHNDLYYWPVGDAPFLAGNGSDALLAAPWLWLFGWPAGPTLYTMALTVGACGAAHLLARQLGSSPSAARIAGVAFGVNSYVLAELTGGRFAQAPIVWMALFVAAFVALLRRPSARTAALAAAAYAVNALVYWYYGWFATLAGAVLVVARGIHLRGRVRPLIAPLALFAALVVALLAGPLAYFATHWAAIPGTGEATFPHPLAIATALSPSWPLIGLREADRATVLPVLAMLPAAAACVRLLAGRGDPRRRWTDGGLLAIAALFWLLSLGPYLWLGGDAPNSSIPLPFQAVYGAFAPLRRFWWPARHALLVCLAVAVLAARGWTAVERRLPPALAPWLALVLAAAIPLEQGLRTPRAAVWSSSWQTPGLYVALADQPGDVLLELPIEPTAVSNQNPMIYQPLHGKRLVNGHAMWVARVRPGGWDTFTEENSFLAALRRLERGDAEGSFAFERADLERLRSDGLRLVTVNRENYLIEQDALYTAERALLRQLFGAPVLWTAHAEVFDTASFDGGAGAWQVGDVAIDAPPPALLDGQPPQGTAHVSFGFGSLEPRSFLRLVRAGVYPQQTRLRDADGKVVRVPGVAGRALTPFELEAMAEPAPVEDPG